jgi:hypothetical protein
MEAKGVALAGLNAAVSAEGSTVCVLMRRLNSSCSRSMAFVVRADFHWLGGSRANRPRSPRATDRGHGPGDSGAGEPCSVELAPPARGQPAPSPGRPHHRRSGTPGAAARGRRGHRARPATPPRSPRPWRGPRAAPSARHGGRRGPPAGKPRWPPNPAGPARRSRPGWGGRCPRHRGRAASRHPSRPSPCARPGCDHVLAHRAPEQRRQSPLHPVRVGPATTSATAPGRARGW